MKGRDGACLFHFSDDGTITTFVPRPVAVPSPRAPGREWLNGPLVWAIEAARQGLYLFPRDCPRIVIWAREDTTDEDRATYLSGARAVAYVETCQVETLNSAHTYRYRLPRQTFIDLGDAGMWVSHDTVEPFELERLTGLPDHLVNAGVELRPVDSLVPLKGLWSTSLHVSGVRLRHAVGWS